MPTLAVISQVSCKHSYLKLNKNEFKSGYVVEKDSTKEHEKYVHSNILQTPHDVQYVSPCLRSVSASSQSDSFMFLEAAALMSSFIQLTQVLSQHWSTLAEAAVSLSILFLLIQARFSLRSQCAWGQCCDQKQHTGSHQCWPV